MGRGRETLTASWTTSSPLYLMISNDRFHHTIHGDVRSESQQTAQKFVVTLAKGLMLRESREMTCAWLRSPKNVVSVQQLEVTTLGKEPTL